MREPFQGEKWNGGRVGGVGAFPSFSLLLTHSRRVMKCFTVTFIVACCGFHWPFQYLIASPVLLMLTMFRSVRPRLPQANSSLFSEQHLPESSLGSTGPSIWDHSGGPQGWRGNQPVITGHQSTWSRLYLYTFMSALFGSSESSHLGFLKGQRYPKPYSSHSEEGCRKKQVQLPSTSNNNEEVSIRKERSSTVQHQAYKMTFALSTSIQMTLKCHLLSHRRWVVAAVCPGLSTGRGFGPSGSSSVLRNQSNHSKTDNFINCLDLRQIQRLGRLGWWLPGCR